MGNSCGSAKLSFHKQNVYVVAVAVPSATVGVLVLVVHVTSVNGKDGSKSQRVNSCLGQTGAVALATARNSSVVNCQRAGMGYVRPLSDHRSLTYARKVHGRRDYHSTVIQFVEAHEWRGDLFHAYTYAAELVIDFVCVAPCSLSNLLRWERWTFRFW